MLNALFPPPSERTPEVIASETATQSFINTPCFLEMFRGTEITRKEPMEFVFRKNLLMMKTRCPQNLHYHFTEDGLKLECFFMLVLNSDAHFTLFEKVVNGGITEFIFRFGLSFIARLIKYSDFMDAFEAETMTGRPRYYVLQRMIVEKSMQGKGIGSKYLNEALKKADEEQLPVFLGTHELRNVTFYSRM